MYEAVPALTSPRDLNQGDIVRGLFRPPPGTEKSFQILRDGNKLQYPFPPNGLSEENKGLRVLVTPSREEICVVVSNSCDNYSGNLPLLLVPTVPFAFRGRVEEHWAEISQAATGTANAKVFYLPGSKKFALERREARLNLMFSVSPDYLARCFSEANASRVCGMTPAAVRHLQWAINSFFSRNPRDDFDWPSVEDLEIKVQALEVAIMKGGKNIVRNKEDLEATKSALERAKEKER